MPPPLVDDAGGEDATTASSPDQDMAYIAVEHEGTPSPLVNAGEAPKDHGKNIDSDHPRRAEEHDQHAMLSSDGIATSDVAGEAAARSISLVDAVPTVHEGRMAEPDILDAESNENQRPSSKSQRSSQRRPKHTLDDSPYKLTVASPGSKRAGATPPAKKRKIKPAERRGESDDTIFVTPGFSSQSNCRMPRILLSGTDVASHMKKWLAKTAGGLLDNVPLSKVPFVCVVKRGKIPTTLKVLRTLVMGKPVVTEDYLHDSWKEDMLPDVNKYIHPDIAGNVGVSRGKLFASKDLFFTDTAAAKYSEWEVFANMLKQAGALSVAKGTAQRGHDMSPRRNTLLLGADHEYDRGAQSLIHEHGRVVFDQKMIPMAILRAQLDLESDEFRLKLPLGAKRSEKKG